MELESIRLYGLVYTVLRINDNNRNYYSKKNV